MPKRPDFSYKLAPLFSYRAASDGVTNRVDIGNKAGILVSEASTGTSRRKPRTSWINPTAYTFTRDEWRAAIGYANYMPHGYPNRYGDKYVGVVGTVLGEASTRFSLANFMMPVYSETSAKADDGLRNRAYIAALNKLKTTNVDLGVAFAERKQTTKLVGDTAIRLANSFNHLKRGSVRKAMNELGITSKRGQPRGSNVPNKWLELQYGWNPLLADVYGACDSLAKRSRDDWRVTAKATRSAKVEVHGQGSVNAAPWMYRGVSCEKSVFVRIDATPTNELLISLSSLGVLNPLNVVWERVPYSFVVDWFLPVGSFLDSLDALVGYSVRGSSSSLFVRAEWYTKGIGVKPTGSGSAKYDNNWTGGRGMVYLDRKVGIAGSLPSFPRFKDPRSLGHMANGLALLAGAFGRR